MLVPPREFRTNAAAEPKSVAPKKAYKMNEASKKKPAKPIARASTPTAWIVIAPLDYGWTHSPLCSPLLMRRNGVPQNYQKRQKCRPTTFLSGPPLEQGRHLIS